jgi:hypothetical protein
LRCNRGEQPGAEISREVALFENREAARGAE